MGLNHESCLWSTHASLVSAECAGNAHLHNNTLPYCIIGASLSEPHLGTYSGCGLCHIMMAYVLPNAHARSLRGEFKGQSRQESRTEEAREVSLRF